MQLSKVLLWEETSYPKRQFNITRNKIPWLVAKEGKRHSNTFLEMHAKFYNRIR